MDDTKDLDLLASAVQIALPVTAINSVKGLGMTEAALVVDMELHVLMKMEKGSKQDGLCFQVVSCETGYTMMYLGTGTSLSGKQTGAPPKSIRLD
jgi:hypothetical protein